MDASSAPAQLCYDLIAKVGACGFVQAVAGNPGGGMMKKMKGVVVPIVTPLKEDDSLDTESLKRLVDHCIDNGLNCLYPNGTTGEMMYFTVEERKKVAETVITHTAGRVPVFVHVGAWNQADTIALAKHAVQSGADGIGVVTPAFYKLSDDGLFDFYKAVAASVPEDFPVYLYSIPQNAVNDIGVSLAERIAAACPNVVGIKYSYPDFTRIQSFMPIRKPSGEPFSVLVGPDHLFEAVCAVGGDGTISGNAMCIPEHYSAIWQAIRDKDFEKATLLQRETNVLNGILCSVNNIAAYKSVLKREGVLSTSAVRRPFENLSVAQEEELFRELDRLEYRKVKCL